MNLIIYILLVSYFSSFYFESLVTRALEGEALIGGNDALPGKYPYHVGIEVFGIFVCGGAIIGDKFVVTAAHCVTDSGGLTKLPVKVIAGVNSLDSKSSRRIEEYADKIYIPKDYMNDNKSTHITSDISVLRLKQSLDLSLNEHLEKLKLPEKRCKLYTGDKAVITGFGWNWIDLKVDNMTGKVNEDGGSYGKLRYAETKIMSNADCQSRYTKKILSNHMCAHVLQHSGNEGVCTGDSGGPLVYNNDTLIGVVSSSPVGCREAKRPAVYTRISEFLKFIHYAVLDLDSPTILTSQPIILRKTFLDYRRR